MFAAAAVFARMFQAAAIAAAQFIATRVLVLALFAIILPWVLKDVFIWVFNWLATYGVQFTKSIMAYINAQSGGALEVDIQLTGIGGYFAQQTGLLEYASIIFTGWGLYWMVAILAKTPRAL